ncbi:hypothetical protein L596_023704 [Steinernema carpocapsae]|uniref:Uncharacterized protein n=1 Tax=Steinernema carpocapsae TaxID=34508 RepID=A0A4U5MEF5_STECR|nr:hypothetical protein L596_023702 [Steinernema carpocapsae]TKR67572.1 hypothetical protein L596_023704 [Steinernema carpocapsae]
MDSLPNVFYEECNALLLSMHNPFELSIVKPKVVLPFFRPWSNEMITVQLTIQPDYYEVSCYINAGGVRFSLEEAFRHQRSFKVFRLHLVGHFCRRGLPIDLGKIKKIIGCSHLFPVTEFFDYGEWTVTKEAIYDFLQENETAFKPRNKMHIAILSEWNSAFLTKQMSYRLLASLQIPATIFKNRILATQIFEDFFESPFSKEVIVFLNEKAGIFDCFPLLAKVWMKCSLPKNSKKHVEFPGKLKPERVPESVENVTIDSEQEVINEYGDKTTGYTFSHPFDNFRKITWHRSGWEDVRGTMKTMFIFN